MEEALCQKFKLFVQGSQKYVYKEKACLLSQCLPASLLCGTHNS